MYTSRAEYRLVLRSDNADLRLARAGYDIGLISKKQYRSVTEKKAGITGLVARLKSTIIRPGSKVKKALEEIGTRFIGSPVSAYGLLKRPEVKIDDMIRHFFKEADGYSQVVLRQAEIDVKYEGYIKRQKSNIKRMQNFEGYIIPGKLDYFSIYGLAFEAQEKLSKIRPDTIGQASRIAGISPSDISILLIKLKQKAGMGA